MIRAHAEGGRLSTNATAGDRGYTQTAIAAAMDQFGMSREQATRYVTRNVAQANANPGAVASRNRTVGQLGRNR